MSPFTGALEAVLAPLNFLARGDFAHLDRVRELEPTLQRGLTRLLSLTDEPAAQDSIRTLVRAVPQPSGDKAARTKALREIRTGLLALHHEPPPSATAPAVSRPPQHTSPAMQAPTLKQGVSKLPVPRRETSSAAALSPKPQPLAKTSPPSAPAPTPKAVALDAPLQFVKGIGPKLAAALAQRGLRTVEDLLRFLPRRYQGRSGYQAIGELQAGEVASVEGEIQTLAQRQMRGRRTLEIVLADETGSLHLVWFRVPGKGFVEQFVRGARLRAAGPVKKYRASLQIVHPEITRVTDSGMTEAVVEDAMIPLYLEIEGVHPKVLRRIITQVLPSAKNLSETLPEALLAKHGLCRRDEAICGLHQPPADTPVEALQDMQTPWHRRLIYEELFFLQLGLLARKGQQTQDPGPVLGWEGSAQGRMQALAKRLLPFTLTGAQSRVLEDIAGDMVAKRPMQRLLQGDVGSGKTAVALMAAAAVAEAGLQAALMAPTELLAEQHARTAAKLLGPAGIRVALLTGHTPTKERRGILADLAEGRLQVLIGTHALIQSTVVFKALGLAIVDEQHRFGVLQRARLTELGQAGLGATPHMLVMTATPIPRTLALTVYGDLDLSIIDELPPGRTPIVTEMYKDAQRDHVYAQVVAAAERGEQAYVVFPLVEESDKEGMGEIRAATQSAEQLAQGPLKNLRLGLLHGRLSADEKDAVMQAFLRRDMDVLVATTVIEVGIDVPNATVMVIEHAERFGLSQLHQLRGRVGRGSGRSSCYLLARNRPSEEALRRLGVMTDSQDGFRIAEEDLAIRGPGDFIGTRQSGLPVLSMANLARDGQILSLARQDAAALLQADPLLSAAHNQALKQTLQQVWSTQHKLVQVG